MISDWSRVDVDAVVVMPVAVTLEDGSSMRFDTGPTYVCPQTADVVPASEQSQ